MSMATHTGSHWRADMPSDWNRRENRDGIVYFESADARNGLCIAVWGTPSTEQAVDEVLKVFVASTMESQDALAGYKWARQTVPLEEGEVLLESVAAEPHHRILTRFIASSSLVLRASFHDYQFTRLPESNGRLGPSLQAVWLTNLS